MANHLPLAEHFTTDQLRQRCRSNTGPVERAHWQVIWLKSQGYSTPEIASVTDYSPNWIRTLIHRYNKDADAGLQDQRLAFQGATPMLSNEQQAKLARLLDTENAPDGGPWNGPKVARWIERETGRAHVHDQRGWDYLVRLGFSAQSPRPRHAEADAAAQAAFKK